jgi:hypothetical protein
MKFEEKQPGEKAGAGWRKSEKSAVSGFFQRRINVDRSIES